MNRMPSGHSLSTAPHILGVVAATLVLAAPLARAEAAAAAGGSSSDAGHRAEGVEGPTGAVATGDRRSGTRDSGLIPGVLIGPRLSLLALPTPALGVEAKILRYVGLSFDYGFFPKIDISGVSVSYSMWNVAARVYPWGNAFFIGAVYGHYGV